MTLCHARDPFDRAYPRFLALFVSRVGGSIGRARRRCKLGDGGEHDLIPRDRGEHGMLHVDEAVTLTSREHRHNNIMKLNNSV